MAIGVVAAVTVAAASAALASSSSDETPTKNAAATVPASKAKFLIPVGTLVREGKVALPAMTGDTGKVGVPKGTPAPLTATNFSASTGTGVYKGSGGTLSPTGIATLALKHGCSAAAAPIATAVAMAESGGAPGAQGDISLMTPEWDWSAGLWQVRGLKAQRGTGQLRDSIANQNPEKNAAAMYVISSGCSDWFPWSTYNNGMYTGFMSIATQAVQYVLAYYNSHNHQWPAVPAPDPNATIPSAGVVDAATLPPSQSGGPAGPRASHKAAQRKAQKKTTTRRSGTRAPVGATTPAAPRKSVAVRAPSPTTRASHGVTLPVPLPTSKLPLPTRSRTTLPLPLPTTSLPVPLPTLPGL